MTRKDWALLVIAAAQGKPVSPVQLQKALFLIGQTLTPTQLQTQIFYDFAPYDYGPFDGAIYLDAEQLEREGLVSINFPPLRSREYVATPAGVQHAAALEANLTPGVTHYLDEVVQWVSSLSFNELVRAIYAKYPAMKVNSVFRE